jgi:hypothetical protein
LAEPRSSPAPHFDGQRALSAGGLHDCATALPRVNAIVASAKMLVLILIILLSRLIE